MVSLAAPLITISTPFIANSIAIIEINDIPAATLNADFHGICFERIMLSSAMDVRIPLTIASAKIMDVDQAISNN